MSKITHSLKSISFVYVFILVFVMIPESRDARAQETTAKIDIPESVYKNRTFMDLLKLMAERHTLAVKDGEYIRGSWEEVKKSEPPEGIMWIYPRGVTLHGLMMAYDILQDQSILDYVRKHNEVAARQYVYLNWQERTFGMYTNAAKMEQLLWLDMLDHCGALTNQMVESVLNYGVTPTPEMWVVMNRVADYVANRQARLANGAFWRPLQQWRELIKTLWIDDLYMGCPFLIRWYQFTGNKEFLEDAINQVIQYSEYCQDDDGVWYHGFMFKTNEHSPYKWGRGNGWAMVATTMVLDAIPKEHPKYNEVLTILRNHINGIIPLQAESGLWHQILTHPELWEETSCSAMFAYSIAKAVNEDWIEKDKLKVAEKALKGVNTQITEDGAMLNVGKGTNIGFSVEYYEDRARPYDDFHGFGPVLMALAEFIKAKQS